MNLKINRSNLFIPSLLLYITAGTVGVVVVSQQLVNTTDLYSQIYAICTLIIFCKVFLTGYANLSYSAQSKRWFVMGLDIMLIIYQIWAALQGLLWLIGDTYPRNTVGFLLLSSIGYTTQLLLGKLSHLVKWSSLAILFYSILLAVLYYTLFNADTRFLQLTALLSIIIEIIFLFVTLRILQKSENLA